MNQRAWLKIRILRVINNTYREMSLEPVFLQRIHFIEKMQEYYWMWAKVSLAWQNPSRDGRRTWKRPILRNSGRSSCPDLEHRSFIGLSDTSSASLIVPYAFGWWCGALKIETLTFGLLRQAIMTNESTEHESWRRSYGLIQPRRWGFRLGSSMKWHAGSLYLSGQRPRRMRMTPAISWQRVPMNQLVFLDPAEGYIQQAWLGPLTEFL